MIIVSINSIGNINLYNPPLSSSHTSIITNTSVTIEKYSSGWYEVKMKFIGFNGDGATNSTGWVMSSYLKKYSIINEQLPYVERFK